MQASHGSSGSSTVELLTAVVIVRFTTYADRSREISSEPLHCITMISLQRVLYFAGHYNYTHIMLQTLHIFLHR